MTNYKIWRATSTLTSRHKIKLEDWYYYDIPYLGGRFPWRGQITRPVYMATQRQGVKTPWLGKTSAHCFLEGVQLKLAQILPCKMPQETNTRKPSKAMIHDSIEQSQSCLFNVYYRCRRYLNYKKGSMKGARNKVSGLWAPSDCASKVVSCWP